MVGPERLSATNYNQSNRAHKNLASDMPNEPGKCFAKCLIPDLYEEIVIDSMAMYTGQDSSNIMFAERMLQEARKGTKWVKKKADRECLSKDPNDCLVWCLVEEDVETVTIKYLADTSQTDEWEYQTITKDVFVESGGYTEWKEVICENKIDDWFYEKLKSALDSRGYDMDLYNKGFSAKEKVILKKFQKDNGLPIGQLDVETLEALGIYSY